MTHDEIRKILIDSLVRIAPEVDPSTIDSAESLREQLDIDSMDFLRFVTAVHEATGVDVPEKDYAKVDGLDAAIAYLSERLPR